MVYFRFCIHWYFRRRGEPGIQGRILAYWKGDTMFRELVLADDKSICIRDWVVSSRLLMSRNESKAAMAEAIVIIPVMLWLKMNEKYKFDPGRKNPAVCS